MGDHREEAQAQAAIGFGNLRLEESQIGQFLQELGHEPRARVGVELANARDHLVLHELADGLLKVAGFGFEVFRIAPLAAEGGFGQIPPAGSPGGRGRSRGQSHRTKLPCRGFELDTIRPDQGARCQKIKSRKGRGL
jgi:hypothetical protein